MIKPLPWQSAVLADYSKKPLTDYVIVAGTGCGKTTAGVLLAHNRLRSRAMNSTIILILAPLRCIKKGWEKTAKRQGIKAVSRPVDIAPDTEMYISTYAGGKSALGIIEQYCSNRELVIVFDEFHHLEENNSWANPFVSMSPSEYCNRIFLSGTPWHESGNISSSMVPYDEQGIVKANWTYTYGKNVNEPDPVPGSKDPWARNTVPVHFQPYHVQRKIIYIDKVSNEPVVRDVDTDTACRSDSLGDFTNFSSIEELCLNTGLTDILRDATRKLSEIRRYQMPKAGGIVFVKDKTAGLIVKQYLSDYLQAESIFVTSDDPKSHNEIERFGNSYDSWIIAIDMVAEGVDIPRLSVVADLTNRCTLLHIIQRWGRVLRLLRFSDAPYDPEPQQSDAFIFFVAHPKLKYVAEQIEKEIENARNEKGEPGEPPPESTLERVGSNGNGEEQDTIFKGDVLSNEENDLATWLLNTNYNGIQDARYSFLQALILARTLLEFGSVPESYIPSAFNTPALKPPVCSFSLEFVPAKDKAEGVRRLSKIKGRIAHTYYSGDYSMATANLNKTFNVCTWSSNNQSLEDINLYLESAEGVERELK